MGKILVVLFGQMMDPTMIYYDNQSCIKLSENIFFHDQSKHIDTQYQHLWDCVHRRILLFEYIPTEEYDAHILTKALSRWKFEFHKGRIEVTYNPFLIERECWKWQKENQDLIFPWTKLGENYNSTSQENENELTKLISLSWLS